MRDDPINLQSPDYTPGRLLTETAAHLGVPTAYQLALALEVYQSTLSRVYRRQAPLTSNLMVRIMDRTNWPIQKVRALAGMPYDGAEKLAPVINQCREAA